MLLVLERRLLDVATVVARSLDLDHDYAFNLVTQGKTDNVMVLLRALNVAWTAAAGVLKLRGEKLGQQLCGRWWTRRPIIVSMSPAPSV